MAISTLGRTGARMVARSRLYRTAFVPAGEGEDVINAAVLLETDRGPEAVLRELHRIEAEFGRARKMRWGSRTLDLDLVMMGAFVLPDEASFRAWADLDLEAQRQAVPRELILPHPRLAERAFVLVPAAEIAPDLQHPVSGLTVAEMLAALPEADVRAVRSLPS